MKRILLFIILVLIINSCEERSSQTSDVQFLDGEEIPNMERMLAAAPSPEYKNFETDETEVVEIEENESIENSVDSNKIKKKIIKDGRIKIEVDNLEDAKNNVDKLIKSKGGYYANDRFDDSEYESSYVLKIRIPSVYFESFVSEFNSQKGKIIYKEISSRDVTSEFIDLETRLSNKRKYLEKYRDLLKSAKSVKDVLEIENEIRGLEEEIESTVGRLKYLKDLVGYSTLDVVLSKKKDFKYNPETQDSFFERLKQSLSNGFKTGVSFILVLISLWPFWLILPVLIYFLRKYRENRKSKK